MNKLEVSRQTIRRLPIYLRYLEKVQELNIDNISIPTLAKALGLTDILVKKDLSYVVSEAGKPKTGHKVENLINDIKQYLGYNSESYVVLVGAGQLGRALIGYNGFIHRNIHIVAAFDTDKNLIGSTINGIKVYDVKDLEKECEKRNIHIGIITVTEEAAQDICNRLVSANIKAIWNFAPIMLKSNKDVIIQNENLASSLAILTRELNKNEESKKVK